MRGRTGELGRNTGADSPTKRAVTRERAGQGCTGGPRASVAAKSLKPQWFPGVPQVVNMARVARSQTLGTSGPRSLVPLAPGARVARSQTLGTSGPRSLVPLAPATRVARPQTLGTSGPRSLVPLAPGARVARSQTLGTSGPHSLVPLAPGPLVRFASPKVAFQSSADKLLRILEKQFMSHLLLEAPGATQTRAGAGTSKPTANPSQGPTAGLEWSQGERRPMLGTEGRVG